MGESTHSQDIVVQLALLMKVAVGEIVVQLSIQSTNLHSYPTEPAHCAENIMKLAVNVDVE